VLLVIESPCMAGQYAQHARRDQALSLRFAQLAPAGELTAASGT
jgi:hypothetical protein